MKRISPLKQARLDAGLSLKEASFFLSVHPTTLLRYEKGECPIPQGLFPALSKLYQIPPASLCRFTETDYLLKSGFYMFYWQPDRSISQAPLISYLEALSPPQEQMLLFYFRLLDKRAQHQLLGLAIYLARTKGNGTQY